MQKKSKFHINRRLMQKTLILLLIAAFAIFSVSMVRNVWTNMRYEQVRSLDQIATLQNKVDMLHEDVRMVTANNPVDIKAYTTAQVKNAYLLVRTAATSLQQDQDVAVAKQLMQLAYEHLDNLPGSKIEQVKNIIAADQAKLNAVSVTDKGVIQDKLDILDKLIYVLPAYRNPAVDPPTVVQPHDKTNAGKQPWYQSISDMFVDLKNVVRIRKKAEREITVTDLDVARAQFKLMIEQMRWAAFYNNVDVYQRSIKNAQELLPQLFDMNSESVQKFSATLQELQNIQLRTEIPNIQNSVNALQAILVG